MITLRPFASHDWPVLSAHQYPGMPEAEARSLIDQWNTKSYNGLFFEMLAIDCDGRIVGYVSLFAQADGSVSEGVEVYPPFRQQGHAFAAVTQLLEHAGSLGYQRITAQIRQDNAPSLALHKKLGFRITGEFVNKRGNPVYSLEKSL